MNPPANTWRWVSGAGYQWLSSFNEIMREVPLPSLAGDTIYITSDYRGAHKASRYTTTSILSADLESCQQWEVARRQVRSTYLTDGRRMAYKNLGDRQRAKALLPFLEAAGTIDSLVASAVVDKRIGGLVTGPKTLASFREKLGISPNPPKEGLGDSP